MARVRRSHLGAAALAAGLLAGADARASQDGPPRLPPPPPPPSTQPIAPAPGKATPAPAARGPTRVQNAPSSSSSGSGSSSAAAPRPAPAAAEAPAADSSFDTRWAIGVMLGVSTDYLNFGVGARGGLTLDNHLYLGGSLVYHFAGAGAYTVTAPGGTGVYSSSASVFYLGPEVGYDFDLHPVVLRPYIGLGPAFFNSSVSGPGVSESGSSSQFVVWPGATVLWNPPGTIFYVGGDVRFVSVPGGPAVGFFALGGIHLGS